MKVGDEVVLHAGGYSHGESLVKIVGETPTQWKVHDDSWHDPTYVRRFNKESRYEVGESFGPRARINEATPEWRAQLVLKLMRKEARDAMGSLRLELLKREQLETLLMALSGAKYATQLNAKEIKS